MSTARAFIQLDYTGHRFHYIRTLVEACGPGDGSRLFTTREALASREFKVHLSELTARGLLQVTAVGASKEAPRRLVYTALRMAVETRALRVIVPDADRLLLWLLWGSFQYRRSALPEIRLLIMRTPEPTMHIGRHNVVACGKIGLAFALRCWWPHSRSYFLTDAFGVVTGRRGYRWMRPVRDPAGRLPQTDRLDARSELGIAPDAFVLGLLGAVGANKRPELTFDAIRYLPDRVVVLVAGRTDESTAQLVGAAERSTISAGQVIWIDEYLTDAQLGKCVSASDAVMLLYELDANSGLLASAIHAGVPIVRVDTVFSSPGSLRS